MSVMKVDCTDRTSRNPKPETRNPKPETLNPQRNGGVTHKHPYNHLCVMKFEFGNGIVSRSITCQHVNLRT